ncbi:MAG: hypothetical protein Q4F65_12210 [Propionibacteriaceae bacterium]|nr:hypothetical protein [Propionibacteriaceae bacterium]
MNLATLALRRVLREPDGHVLADMLGLTQPPPTPAPPRRRALPRHGGGRKESQL